MRIAEHWMSVVVVGSLAILSLSTASADAGGKGKMSFFVTSKSVGKGGDLGGLAGADKHCQSLAAAAGAGKKTWHAYLSTQGTSFKDTTVVNARDRIGSGPWYNAKGVMIAKSVDELHSANNNLNQQTALDEHGKLVNGRAQKPNLHDIVTGSRPDGTAFPPSPPFPDQTCGNWTKNTAEGSAVIGHHDRVGPLDAAWAKSWNSAHPTLGCTRETISKTGGDALLYCFAVK